MRRDRKRCKFQPQVDGLETRMVLSTVMPRPAMVSIRGDLNSSVLSYAKARVGTKVGDGECATLADEAVKSARGKRFTQLGPTGRDADYVWGRKITTVTTTSGSVSSIKPGDIIQFRNVSLRSETTVTKSNGSWSRSTSTSSYSHHTAIVESVSGKFINLLHQNVGSSGKSSDAKKIVQRGTIWGSSFSTSSTSSTGTRTAISYSLQRGAMWVYRPYS